MIIMLLFNNVVSVHVVLPIHSESIVVAFIASSAFM